MVTSPIILIIPPSIFRDRFFNGKKRRFHVKEHYFIPLMCVIVLTASLLVSGCTADFTGGTPVTITPGNPDRPDCGLTPCHGLELTCGPDIPEVCTAVYQLGDKCRQFAHCDVDSNGTCQIVTTPEFDTCTSCVQNCLNEFRTDPPKSFACEETC